MRTTLKYSPVTLMVALGAASSAWTAPSVTTIWSFKGTTVPSPNLVYNNGAIYGTNPPAGRFGAGNVFQLTPPAKAGGPWTETVLFRFPTPYEASVWTFDDNGALYGIAHAGGCGTVFQLTPPAIPGGRWTHTVIYEPSGPCPGMRSIIFRNGALYGVAGEPGMVFQLTPPAAAGAWNLTTLYSFTGGRDGGYPGLYLAFDGAGAIYGTTWYGGSAHLPNGGGTVFQLAPPAVPGGPWTQTTLHVFAGGGDGWQPTAIAIGPDGSIDGTTAYGGGSGCSGPTVTGCGTVFQLSRPAGAGSAWTESVLYSFSGGSDGLNPDGIVIGPDGTIYGSDPYVLFQVTKAGDAWTETNIASVGLIWAAPIFDSQGDLIVSSFGYNGGTGVVYQVRPPSVPGGAWTPTLLYSSAKFVDGEAPSGPLAFDSKSAIYGATCGGGTADSGAVFKLTPPAQTGKPWKEALLYSFSGGADGSQPCSGVVIGENGYLYGTTSLGGQWGHGVVFRLAPPSAHGGTWTETVLHSFGATGDPGLPTSPLVLGDKGTLYGATGGAYGTIFQLTPPAAPGGPWTETILTSAHGAVALALRDGALYGSEPGTFGRDWGKVFQLSPPAVAGSAWTETLLHLFQGGRDGANPSGPLVFDSGGALYGTTTNGGKVNTGGSRDGGCGTVYQLTPVSGGAWTETILFSFSAGGCHIGRFPTSLTFKKGVLYGSTCTSGGPDSMGPGVLFRLNPAGGATKLATAGYCSQVLALDKGTMYGTVYNQGYGFGSVFQFLP